MHVGAGVSRRRCGFDHVSMGVRVTGCAGVWVCSCFFSVQTCLFLTVPTTRGTVPLTLVTARHDRIHSQTFQFFWETLCDVSTRGGPKFRAFFFHLPLPFSFFFSLSGGLLVSVFFSLWGSSRGILVVFWSARTLKCARFRPRAVV